MLLKSDQKDNRKCDGFNTKNTVQLQKKTSKKLENICAESVNM